MRPLADAGDTCETLSKVALLCSHPVIIYHLTCVLKERTLNEFEPVLFYVFFHSTAKLIVTFTSTLLALCALGFSFEYYIQFIV
jgi:hypothetical protein